MTVGSRFAKFALGAGATVEGPGVESCGVTWAAAGRFSDPLPVPGAMPTSVDQRLVRQPQPPRVPPFPGRCLTQPPIMCGDDVRQFQHRMYDRGWRHGWSGGSWEVGRIVLFRADGEYGPSSQSICRRFQQLHGLDVDGEVGPQTWNAAWTTPIT